MGADSLMCSVWTVAACARPTAVVTTLTTGLREPQQGNAYRDIGNEEGDTREPNYCVTHLFPTFFPITTSEPTDGKHPRPAMRVYASISDGQTQSRSSKPNDYYFNKDLVEVKMTASIPE
jgi:hypothetical protein